MFIVVQLKNDKGRIIDKFALTSKELSSSLLLQTSKDYNKSQRAEKSSSNKYVWLLVNLLSHALVFILTSKRSGYSGAIHDN